MADSDGGMPGAPLRSKVQLVALVLWTELRHCGVRISIPNAETHTTILD
jgi:hypothetical protein